MARETSSELARAQTSEAAERAFDPQRHGADILAILREIEAFGRSNDTIDPSEFDAILRRHPRERRGFFSRAEIIAGYRHFAQSVRFEIDEDRFLDLARLRKVRTQSGVTPLTVLTKPFPCPGKCIFCPNDVRMPKSYLAAEPGAQRAANNHFDPYRQTWNRLAAYRAIGHPTDKIELIILGGTWSFHPEPYQIWFIKRCFDALNDFGASEDRRPDAPVGVEVDGGDFSGLSRQGGAEYNQVVRRHLEQQLDGELVAVHERASWGELEAAHRANEDAACRSVGLVVETRPDHISQDEVLRMRRLGCTKVQLGYQSLSDDVLRINRRGHDVDATRRASCLLRAAGFKIHAHWMPNLHGSSPAADIEDFGRVFDDPHLCPDELKIYPCSLIESADLMSVYERGEWRPYTHAELLEVLTAALSQVPRYCRVTRVLRDISSDDIVAGNRLTNFRQIAEQEIERRGDRCMDVRAREIRGDVFDRHRLELRECAYECAASEELFLEFVTDEDRIVAFLRLSLPSQPSFIEEIARSALIREVHVYGAAQGLGERSETVAQHRGLGQRLIEAAVKLARERGFADLAVISAVGTRQYYRRLGFADDALYQHLPLGVLDAT